MTTTSRALVFAEAVTLAHVARPIALASSLKGDFDVRFACAPRYREFFEPGSRDQLLELDSITSSEFLSRLASGRPVYDAATLRRYVEDDLRLIRQINPSVVVGDFRLSLSVSARRAGVPYVALANAYWSPYARPQFELPSHPATRVVGRRLAAAVFRIVQPVAFAYHAMPMNRVRRQFGLASLGIDLRRVYTDADYVAYADIPELIPTYGLPERHSYIGPVLWSTPSPLPAWWDRLPRDRPVIFVTMGSSGDASVLPLIIQALAGLPATVVVASVGAKLPQDLPPNVHTAPYLPADLAARRARLVVCNGGSPTTHHALAAGVPVLGITTNMDQFLNMQYLAAGGVGLRLRADELNSSDVRRQAARLLNERPFADAASAMAAKMASYHAPDRFAAIVRRASQRN
jgi:UDP:flavonoid glycosyltransferase YjiC (YdhE family)